MNFFLLTALEKNVVTSSTGIRKSIEIQVFLFAVAVQAIKSSKRGYSLSFTNSMGFGIQVSFLPQKSRRLWTVVRKCLISHHFTNFVEPMRHFGGNF